MATASTQLVTSFEKPLARLLAFEPSTLPVISLYLNTQSDEHGRMPELVPYLKREFKELGDTWPASAPERRSFDADGERILAYAADEIAAAANGVAIFACSGADLFEVVQVMAPIAEHSIHVCGQPHLFQLLRLDERFPKYAAVLTDTNSAKIFTFALGQMVESDDLDGQKVHRVKVGGWSQARYQRRAQNAHEEHAKELIARLQVIVKEEGVTHIVIAGDSVILPLLEQHMPQELAPLVEAAKLDTHATDHEIFTATLAVLQEREAKDEVEKVERLLRQVRARGLAITGLAATLTALAAGQVDELLISSALEDRPEMLVTQAKQTDADVTIVEDAALLAGVGGVGAFLRWRS